MRVTGWILLLIGAALCATISWAALGFLLMGVGLISLQVAERSRRRTALAVASPAGFIPPMLGAGLKPPTFEPIIPSAEPPQRQPRRVAWPAKNDNGGPYDRDAWRRLVESDPDLARLTRVLADYGPQYVDELAVSYLAAPDKSRLSAIVGDIIARARGSQPAPPPASAAPAPGSRPPPLPRPESQLAIPPEAARPAAAPSPVPANPADTREAPLLAAVEEASAKATARRAPLERPAATRREPAFRTVPREASLDRAPLSPSPPGTSADLEASLIAAVTEAAAKRTDPPKSAATPSLPPTVKAEPGLRIVPPSPQPTPPAGAPADDESLLAALAEISGEKLPDASAPALPPDEPPSPPADEGLTEMIKKFAPDSSFLRKT